MIIEQRLSLIQNYLRRQTTASIEQLSELLNVSKDTVRRDLMKLEKDRLVRRCRGGVTLADKDAQILNYSERSQTAEQAKEKIALAALKLIHPGDKVIFDASTTVETLIRRLNNLPILAITNSLTHAVHLATWPNVEIKVTGGNLKKDHLFLYGENTLATLARYRADLAFIGVFSLSDQGMMIHTEEEGLVKAQMMQHAKKVVALADASKMNTHGFYNISELSAINTLITDVVPDDNLCRALKEANVELIVAG
jgi:DeoR/GlpR family transcriptional regulator of sugar metabolism